MSYVGSICVLCPGYSVLILIKYFPMEMKIFIRMLTLNASEDSKKKALFYKINHGIKFDTFLKLSA